MKKYPCGAMVWLLLQLFIGTGYSAQEVIHEPGRKLITVMAGDSMTLTLSYDRCCMIQQLRVHGHPLLIGDGVCSRLQRGVEEWSSASLAQSPAVAIQEQAVRIGPFSLGPVTETWEVRQLPGRIDLYLQRTFPSVDGFSDASMPLFHFSRIDDWDGGLLGNGGVAWFKLFDTPQATLGAHVDKLTLWNQQRNIGLRIEADTPFHTALRLSRQTDESLVCAFTVSDQEAECRYDVDTHRRRFLTDRQDVWSDVNVSTETVSVRYSLSAVDYEAEYGRGILAGLDQEAITALLNTVARIGVIDTHVHGSNSWRTPYGPAVLHEQWIALLASAIADDDYLSALKSSLSFYRDHAIEQNGRVKSRWAYSCEDAMAGTCDSLGFYEAQWGYLLDSNPDFVINVVELFDLCSDLDWLRRFKGACEMALQFMLTRDQDGDHLLEMMTEDHTRAKGSDWIDIIWASHENAFVNALMYRALTLWADAEELLDDATAAGRYRAFAAGLKASFNKSTTNGGLWDAERQCYIHWRDRDDSIHGRNLVVPVNFMAIAYGLCDDPVRRRAILERVEEQMQKEKLFAWPICLESYEKGEGLDWQFPFPNYENGDIFLGWGQVGVAAYVEQDPVIAVRAVEKLLAQYRRDGLAFQRYLRNTQTGRGDDILANNAMTLVGLYRNIYGIQPKFNRLCLEPHLTPQLNGTQLVYRLNGRRYDIDLSVNDYRVCWNGLAVRGHSAFAVQLSEGTLRYYHEAESECSLLIAGAGRQPLEIHIQEWRPGRKMVWSEEGVQTSAPLQHSLSHLTPNTKYLVFVDGNPWRKVQSDASGVIRFYPPLKAAAACSVIAAD